MIKNFNKGFRILPTPVQWKSRWEKSESRVWWTSVLNLKKAVTQKSKACIKISDEPPLLLVWFVQSGICKPATLNKERLKKFLLQSLVKTKHLVSCIYALLADNSTLIYNKLVLNLLLAGWFPQITCRRLWVCTTTLLCSVFQVHTITGWLQQLYTAE